MLARSMIAGSLCAACLIAAPATAPAATVRLAPPDDEPYGRGWAAIAYHAAPGEANRIVLTEVDQYTLRVTDAGAVIAAGEGCRSLDAHSAECTVAGMPGANGLIAARVHAGDLDDVVDSRGPGLTADGGPGDDRLESSSLAAGTLDGGGGRDTLLGGRNQDTLIDGDTTGAADSDVLDGRGNAIVSYAGRTAPVVVDLAGPGLGGEAGERDVIRGVRGVTGGSGDDELTGDSGRNRLIGGAGRDRLEGGADADWLEGGRDGDRLHAGDGMDSVYAGRGADVATGGAGTDVLDGGRGRDRLRAGAGDDYLTSGAAWCGTGRDQVRPADRDQVASDCEQLAFPLPMRDDEFADAKEVAAEPYPVARRRGVLVLRLRCPALVTDGYPTLVRLRGVLRLRAPSGRVVGTGRIPPRSCDGGDDVYEDPAELPWVRVAVRAGRSLPRRLTVGFSGRNVPPVRWRIRLR